MDERELAEALQRIEQRLDRLERFTRLAPEQQGVAEPPPAPAPPPTDAPPLSQAARTTLVSPVPSPPAAAPAGLPSSSGLSEQMVGGRMAAWVGAILVMIGVGVFLKYAYDHEWLGRFGPTERFIGATALAIALVTLGEFALRRWGRAAGAGLLCAGLGSLFVIAAAGTQPEVMLVFSPTGALGFSLGAVVLGALLAARSRLLVVGVVVLVGASLVPILTGALRLDRSIWPACYITAVLASGLALAQFVPSQAPLRGVASGIHLPMALLVLVGRSLPPALSQFFVGLWWAMIAAESVLSVLRRDGAVQRDGAPAGRSGTLESVLVTLATLVAIGASFFFAGAWSGWRDPWAWMPLAQGALCLVAAAQLGAVRTERSTAGLGRMVVTLAAMGGAAVLSAVALLLDPRSASVAWAVMGAGAVFAATRIASRGLIIAALAALAAAALTAAWLALGARWSGGGVQTTIPGLGASSLVFARGWWLPLGTTVAALFATHCLAPPAGSIATRSVAAILAVASFASLCAAVGTRGSALLVGILLPLWWSLGPAPVGDRFQRRAGAATATVLTCLCALAALWTLGGPNRIDLTSLAIAVLVGGGLMALSDLREPESRPRALLAAGMVLVGACGLLIMIGATQGDEARRSYAELSVVAALAAVVAIVLRMADRRTAALGTGVAVWSAVAWIVAAIVFGTLGGAASAPPMSNLSNATAALVLAALGSCMTRAMASGACAFLMVVLVAGTMDLERLVRSMDPAWEELVTARQAVRSVWWAVVAAAGVIAGFRWRITALRWFSLAILTVTAAKVLIVDLQRAATLARVAALVVVGLLLVGVSVIYARAERRLRAAATP